MKTNEGTRKAICWQYYQTMLEKMYGMLEGFLNSSIVLCYSLTVLASDSLYNQISSKAQ